MQIGSKVISADHPPYIIAELGVNHDGSAEKALELARAAIGAGVDAIKLQYFEADRLMSRASRLAGYQEAAGETDPIEMLRRLEMSIGQMAPIVELAHASGVHAIVTVFSDELHSRTSTSSSAKGLLSRLCSNDRAPAAALRTFGGRESF